MAFRLSYLLLARVLLDGFRGGPVVDRAAPGRGRRRPRRPARGPPRHRRRREINPLRVTDDGLLALEDIALGYKQLLQVERGWRDMKTTLELRPVYHRLEDRIRAHVTLCWLALLLIRIAETTTGDTWSRLREDLQELYVGTFEGPAGTFRQRTELTTAQRDILAKLDIDPPKKIIELGPPATP